jgi:hypothetical protein
MGRVYDIGKLRHPLYGALLFSPIYLLVDRKVPHNAWSQFNMILASRLLCMADGFAYYSLLPPPQLSKALGNQKPELLTSIEHALWKVLLDIATGRNTAFPAMHDFFSNLPWDELQMVDASISEFFTDGKPRSFAASSYGSE